jgi:hypothetical protein
VIKLYRKEYEVVLRELLISYLDKDIKRSKSFIKTLNNIIKYVNAKRSNNKSMILLATENINRKYKVLFDVLLYDDAIIGDILYLLQTKMIELKDKYIKGYNKPIR